MIHLFACKKKECCVHLASSVHFYHAHNTGNGLHFCINIIYGLCCSSDPVILPCQQVDKGAIKFLLSGANVMCRGLTSPGAILADLPKDAIVVSFLVQYAEGRTTSESDYKLPDSYSKFLGKASECTSPPLHVRGLCYVKVGTGKLS